MKNFWELDTNLNILIKELQKDKPNATLWDVFSNFKAEEIQAEPAIKTEEWLQKQDTLIQTVIEKELNLYKQLTQKDIEDITLAIQEYTYPADEQDDYFLNTKFMRVAKIIAKEYLVQLKLNDNTLSNFLDKLENQLQKIHHKTIQNDGIQFFKDAINKLDYYSETKKEEIINNYESSVKNTYFTQFEEDEEPYDKFQDYINYPSYPLAISGMFYGFDGDLGHLEYDERFRIVDEKMTELKKEISALIGDPDASLEVNRFDFEKNPELYDKYDAFFDEHQCYFLSPATPIWNNGDKVLILSWFQEDKELPFQIKLYGLTLKNYLKLKDSYNTALAH